MINRSVATVALAAVLLLVGLLAPVAGAERPGVAGETVVERLDGLPPGEPAGAFTSLDEASASEPVETPIPFSMVAFEAPRPVPAWFRTSADGHDWTAWEEVHWQPEEAPDPGTAEARSARAGAMSAPAWVGEAGWVQTRVAGAGTSDVAVHLIDSSGLHRNLAQRTADAFRAAWRGTGTPAAATVDGPAIVTRSQWGADESLRRGTPSYASRARTAFVHHTAGGNDYSRSDVPAILRGIYAFHTRSRGWSDIGYNLLVDRFGRIYEGRAGGLDRAVIGAHAAGFNTGSIGVSVLGNFEHTDAPAAAVDSIARLLAWKFDVHHIDVDGSVEMTSGGGGTNRYPRGAEVTLRSINGHRDTGTTSCPGRLYDELPALRGRVAALASDMFVDPSASPAVVSAEGGAAPDPVTLSARLKPAGSWDLRVRDADGGVAHSASGSGTRASSTWRPSAEEPGTYTYEFTSSGRRPATGSVRVSKLLLDRLGASSDAVRGAVEVSRTAFPEDGSAEHAVVVRGDVFADAMAGGPLAGTQGPLLLTGSGALHSRVRAELERVLAPAATVYVLGGTQALSDAVVDDLEGTWTVERIGGEERTETAALVAAEVRARSGTDTVMLARSAPDSVQPWADALAGGAYGAREGVPVLLTPSGQLTPATEAALDDVSRTIVLGGTLAVSDAVLAQVPGARRVRGQDRAGTAAAIAGELWGRTSGRDGDLLVLGGGYRAGAWTMTLAAAPLAARENAPLLLANSATLPPETRDYLASLGYGASRRASGWVVGSTAAVGDAVVDEVSRLLD